MAHGITSTDGLVLHKETAWHGLGKVVENAPTPREALQLADLDWNVVQTNDIWGSTATSTVKSHKWRLNYRSDNHEVLGCVSNKYQPIQNYELAKFCEELSMDTVVKVESAGSLFGGSKIWFLLKADTFDLGKNGKEDPVVPYVLVANGHDGGLSFSARPTSVRVVCNNTLSWAMDRKQNVFSLRHTQNLMSRVDEARKQMKDYLNGINTFKEACHHLRNTRVERGQAEEFFLSMYSNCVRPVPETTTRDSEEIKILNKAYKDIDLICQKYNRDLSIAGDSYWNAFNACSEWLQKDRPRTQQSDKLQYNKVLGNASDNTTKAFNIALDYAK